jgi:excisionase family DNA binding protein
MINEQTLTIKEVAKFLNISNQMVYNLIRDKEIEAFKVGSAIRILYSDLLAYVEKQKLEFHKNSETIENTDENIFLVKNLNFHREEFQLKHINFEFPRGKILAILGASGSGKTMLLKALAGLNRPDSGAVFLGTDRLDNKASADRNIGFVFEEYALMPNRSGRGNIRFPLEVQKKSKKLQIDPAVEEMAGRLNIKESDLDRMVKALPEGVKQLIAIGRADIRNIDILIMDEPLARLDSRLRMQMRVFLKELVAGLGKTTIISLHDPETALALSDYIGIIDKGRLLQFGQAMDVYNNPASATAFELTSRFAVNKLPVTVSKGIIQPFKIPCDEKDGDYELFFRANEVKLSESDRGIEAGIEAEHVVDSSRILAECSSKWGEITAVLPAGSKGSVVLEPIRYNLYSVNS